MFVYFAIGHNSNDVFRMYLVWQHYQGPSTVLGAFFVQKNPTPNHASWNKMGVLVLLGYWMMVIYIGR